VANNTFSINMTGFGQGNLFLNGHHVAYFDLVDGACSHPPKGGFGNWPGASYVPGACGVPTQDCYHVPPEWLHYSPQGETNELMVWNEAKMPHNVSTINPDRSSIVYRPFAPVS
jgi:hypothetical protein